MSLSITRLHSCTGVNAQSPILSYGVTGCDLCDEEIHPGQQVDQDQTEDKQIINLWLDRTQERIHGSQGQELPGTTEKKGGSERRRRTEVGDR